MSFATLAVSRKYPVPIYRVSLPSALSLLPGSSSTQAKSPLFTRSTAVCSPLRPLNSRVPSRSATPSQQHCHRCHRLPSAHLDRSLKDDAAYLKGHELVEKDSMISGWVNDVTDRKGEPIKDDI